LTFKELLITKIAGSYYSNQSLVPFSHTLLLYLNVLDLSYGPKLALRVHAYKDKYINQPSFHKLTHQEGYRFGFLSFYHQMFE
jgi:hypothetical protein